MSAVTHDIRLGALRISNTSDRVDAHLLRLRSELTMDGVGVAHVVLAPGDYALPVIGEEVSIVLDNGGGATNVFRGDVRELDCAALELRVAVCGGLGALAWIECSRAFEHAKAGDIARALVDDAGATAGTIEAGPRFPSYVLHRGPSALEHLRRLARLCGVDVFEDGEGKVHFAGPESKGTRHTFNVREHVLELTAARALPSRAGATVWGEGAASTKGSERAHWLPKDLASVSAVENSKEPGSRTMSREARSAWVSDGAVRTGEVAESIAKAQARARAARAVRGAVTVSGAPKVVPGDAIVLEGLPREHPAIDLLDGAELRARRVEHALGARGFVTRVEFAQ